MKRVKIEITSKVLWGITIFIIAFVLRLGLLLYVTGRVQGNFGRTCSSDSTSYIMGAVNLLRHGIFCASDTTVLFRDFFRTPGYPLLIAAVYLLSNFSDTWLLLVQFVISSLTCVVLFLIALNFISKPIAAAVALFLAFDISSIINANHIMTETFFTFLVMLMALFFIKFFQEGKKYYLAIAGLLCGFATLTRPLLFYFPILAILFIVVSGGKGLKKGIVNAAVFVLCCLIVVGPWLARNLDIGYRGIAAVQEFNIYMYKAGWIEARMKTNNVSDIKIDFTGRTERVKEEIEKEGLENNALNRVATYKRLGMRVLLEHPYYLLEYQTRYTLNIFTADGVHLIFDKIPADMIGKVSGVFKRMAPKVYKIALFIVYLAALMGIVAWFRTPGKKRGLLFIVILCGYIIALSGEMSEGSRFRVPIIPLVLLLSGFGIDFIKIIILERKRSKIADEKA